MLRTRKSVQQKWYNASILKRMINSTEQLLTTGKNKWMTPSITQKVYEIEGVQGIAYLTGQHLERQSLEYIKCMYRNNVIVSTTGQRN